MNNHKHSQSATPNGEKSNWTKLFELYVYLCLVWVIFALGLDLFIIIRHIVLP